MIMHLEPASARRKNVALTYQIQILLNGSEPSVWRRLLVPGAANLGWVHAVLQVAMGWTNSHLHQFICGETIYADECVRCEQFEGDPPILDERKFTLAKLLTDTGQGLIYDYDFGDSWEHIVIVEKIFSVHASISPAVCLAGSHACPPEDCGGIGGYAELLKALKNKRHPEHKSMKEWLGRPFDPGLFDVAKTNHWLRKLKWPRVTEGQLRKILMARDDYHE